MTPEERWTKIENAIEALLGSQAQHEAEIAEQRSQIAENSKQITRIGEQMERKTVQIDAQIEKNTAAIRDLIVVSRTVLETQQNNEKRMDRMHSEIKAEIERLIRAVETFLKGFQKPNGNS